MKKITKKLVAAAAVILLSIGAKATVLTVNNGIVNGGHFTSLQMAIDSALAGDTIYVHGSPNSYGDITVNKKLTLIGAGYAVTGTAYNFNTTIGTIKMDTTQFFNGSSGSQLIGLNAYQLSAGYQNWLGYYSPLSLHISRCSFTYSNTYPNSLVENCIFNNSLSLNTSNAIIRNCIINGFNGNGTTANGVIYDHNIFNGCSPYNISNATFTNNVFFFSGVASSSWNTVNNCVFNKNMTFDNLSSALPYGSNSGTGNIASVMPTFQFNNTLTAAGTNVWNINWTLKTTSAGHNAATDGTDVGIYGGTYPMKNLTGASNLIPQMTLMNIINTSIPLNGTLNVNFKSRKQN